MSQELKLHLVINGATLDATRTKRATGGADPTEIVRWVGTFRGRPFDLSDFLGIISDAKDPSWRGEMDDKSTPPWERDTRLQLVALMESMERVDELAWTSKAPWMVPLPGAEPCGPDDIEPDANAWHR